MIKNVVFDLGNVLVSFRPAEFFDRKKYPEQQKAIILQDIFASREWAMLDNGDISLLQAVEAIASRSSLKRDEITRIFNLRKEIILPIGSNLKMLPELKKRGYRLYYLSNFPIDIWEEFKNSYCFFRQFDGGVISAEVKVSKPDPRIYRILTEKYSLLPEECLYIDDIEANVKAAELTGMKGIFTNGAENISDSVYRVLGINGSPKKFRNRPEDTQFQ